MFWKPRILIFLSFEIYFIYPHTLWIFCGVHWLYICKTWETMECYNLYFCAFSVFELNSGNVRVLAFYENKSFLFLLSVYLQQDLKYSLFVVRQMENLYILIEYIIMNEKWTERKNKWDTNTVHCFSARWFDTWACIKMLKYLM